jgi:protein-L-isoaspartate(D-aspartate) O-methyltransferase
MHAVPNPDTARRQMIDQQVRAWDVLDERVLDAMRSVRRELFVPAAWRELAFADSAVPLGQRQSMLAPSLHGRILQALNARPGEEVLEIGAGSGYLTACLARMAGAVSTVEIFPELSALAGENLRAAGIGAVNLQVGDAMALQTRDRYDAIALTGSLPVYDPRFEQALKPGGRLFVVVGEAPIMEAFLVRRVGAQQWTRESLFETVIDALVHAPRPPPFVF